MKDRSTRNLPSTGLEAWCFCDAQRQMEGDLPRRELCPATVAGCESALAAYEVIASGRVASPLVIKADGLAAEKGVLTAWDRASAERAVEQIMLERIFDSAGP